jgi:hypothetical protein
MSFVPKYRDVLATLGAPEDAVATSTSGEWSAMSLLKAIYAGVQTIGSPELDIAGDTGTGTIELATETLTFAGANGLAASVSANTVSVGIGTAATVRSALGLVIGTNVQAWDAQLDTWAGVTPSANGQSLVSAADYAAMKALLDLEIGTDVQAYDADLTTWAGLTPSANAQSLVTAANYAAMRALLDLEAGTDFYSIAAADAAFQPLDSDLTSWAGVTRASGFDTFAATPSLANLGSLLTDEATGLITFMTTASSANLRALLTDETGTGLAYFQGGDAGTPSALVLTNATGLTSGGVAAATLVTAADTVAANDNDTTWPTTAAIIDYAQPLDSDLTALAALTTTAAARTLLEIADPGADRPVVWDDTAGVFKAMAIADMTTEAAPAAGDYVMIMGAEGDWRKADWSTLPGAGGGINNVSEDTSPSLGGLLDGDGFDVTDIGVLTMREQAAAEADVAGLGQWWVQTATPNLPMFTNDAGTDFQLATLTGTEALSNKTLTAVVLGTPASGTLTNCTGLPVAGIAASTSTALGVGSLEVGHASDTTISRSAAGVIAVEGVPLFAGIPINSQSTAYSTVLADAQKCILHPTADNNARTFTIDGSVSYPVGTVISFANQINTVTISIGTDTLTMAGSGSTGSRTLAANGMATAFKIASGNWVISGIGLT